MSKHPIVHIELSAHDREKAGEFFSDLFGWTVRQMPEMNYASFDTGVEPGGGFNPVSDDNPAGTVRIYVGTDDIETTLAKVEALGGKVILPKTVIPMTGWFAFFSDPTGNVIGLYTPMQSAQS